LFVTFIKCKFESEVIQSRYELVEIQDELVSILTVVGKDARFPTQ